MRNKLVTNIVAIVLVLAGTSVWAESLMGDVTFDFADWSGPPIPVRLFVPDAVDAETPIVIVMHGASRDAERYYENWRSEAAVHDFVVIVPYFSREHFPKSAHYNLGRLPRSSRCSTPSSRCSTAGRRTTHCSATRRALSSCIAFCITSLARA